MLQLNITLCTWIAVLLSFLYLAMQWLSITVWHCLIPVRIINCQFIHFNRLLFSRCINYALTVITARKTILQNGERMPIWMNISVQKGECANISTSLVHRIHWNARQGFFLKYGAQICQDIWNSCKKCLTGSFWSRSCWVKPRPASLIVMWDLRSSKIFRRVE